MDYFFNTGIHTRLDAIYALDREQARNSRLETFSQGACTGQKVRLWGGFSDRESMMVIQGGTSEVGLCPYYLGFLLLEGSRKCHLQVGQL